MPGTQLTIGGTEAAGAQGPTADSTQLLYVLGTSQTLGKKSTVNRTDASAELLGHGTARSCSAPGTLNPRVQRTLLTREVEVQDRELIPNQFLDFDKHKHNALLHMSEPVGAAGERLSGTPSTRQKGEKAERVLRHHGHCCLLSCSRLLICGSVCCCRSGRDGLRAS